MPKQVLAVLLLVAGGVGMFSGPSFAAAEVAAAPAGSRSAALHAAAPVVVAPVAVGEVVAPVVPPLVESTVPEQVATYFASALVARLADLYAPTDGSKPVFDATNSIGTIHRVRIWTPTFLRGAKTDDPTELTNNWVASVTTSGGRVLGLAAVWINPQSDLPELANFARGSALVAALSAAPAATVILRDDAHSAWFATDGTTLTPLIVGTSGVTTVTTAENFQRLVALSTPAVATASNRGLFVAVGVLALVVVLLAIFVLLPDRWRWGGARAAGRSSRRVAGMDVGPAVAAVEEVPVGEVATLPPAELSPKPRAKTSSTLAKVSGTSSQREAGTDAAPAVAVVGEVPVGEVATTASPKSAARTAVKPKSVPKSSAT